MLDKKKLLQAIAKEEALLSRLEKVRKQAFSRMQDYKRELASLEAACSESQASYPSRSSQEKVGLFRSLFRGREDVFPRLWTSRAGKRGYSPACTNDWMSGVCGKTRKPPVKCSECSNRKFLPVTDQVIIDSQPKSGVKPWQDLRQFPLAKSGSLRQPADTSQLDQVR